MFARRLFAATLLCKTTLLLGGVAAHAQSLPAPAPIPQKPAPKPTPTPAPLAAASETDLPFEQPIVIGEPVRNQVTPKPTPGNSRRPAVKRSVAAGVEITGLSEAAAINKMRATLSPALKAPFRVIIGDYQYSFERHELGASLALWPMMREARQSGNSALIFDVDTKALEKALRELDVSVRNDFETLALNVGGTMVRVEKALRAAPPQNAAEALTVRLAPPASEPQAPAATPKTPVSTPTAKGAFGHLLASFSTSYDASLRGRTTNLRMAAKNIDGTVVAPGRVFSTNAAIGPRNAAAGWREAKMFVSGRVVSGTGAGICQASSTLYNAVLRANLPVVERHAHSMRVTYVPPSLDAALLWGSKDFKFRNNTGAPIKVETEVAGGKFHVRLWSQQPRKSPPVNIVSRVLSRANGTRSVAFKVVGGQQTQLSRDYYRPKPN